MKKKWVNWLIDGLLGLFIVFLLSCQIQMLVTQNKKENYGVPRCYGLSFMAVMTDSMEGTNPDSLKVGTGIIVKQVAPEEVKLNDVVTFYHVIHTQSGDVGIINTHRIVDEPYKDEAGLLQFHTRGDNYSSQSASFSKAGEYWDQSKLIGKVITHNDVLGNILQVISPTVSGTNAALNGTSSKAWVFPLLILLPVALIATISIVDVIKANKKEKLAYETELNKAMEEAGINKEDERERTLFEQKYAFKIEYREKMAKEMEKARKEAAKQLQKEKK